MKYSRGYCFFNSWLKPLTPFLTRLKGLNMSQNICTSQELKEFATTSEITINELSKFIEDKTSQQYVIVQKDFVKAISKQLFNNTVYIIDINKFLNDSWSKIVTDNQNTTDKWKTQLKVFEV